MSHLKEIRGRLTSVHNTEQITKAMKMVAAARLRKAQQRILNLRPYAHQILSVMKDVALACDIQHPVLIQKDVARKILLVVLTSDRGLCGGFNNNICRSAENFYQTHNNGEKLDFFFIGKKAKNYFQFRGQSGMNEITQLDKEISYELAQKIAVELIHYFTQGRYDKIYFIYNSFKSVIAQKVTKEVFLPLDLSEVSLEEKNIFSKDLIFEVPASQLIEDLIKKHFTVQAYRCMCESVAAEYGARMSAMDNATKNAKEIISHLTLTFNKLRQSSITTELIEVSSGVEAMK